MIIVIVIVIVIVVVVVVVVVVLMDCGGEALPPRTPPLSRPPASPCAARALEFLGSGGAAPLHPPFVSACGLAVRRLSA